MPHRLFAGLPDTPLVTTDWLAEHLGADELVVLDATVLRVTGFNGSVAYVSGEEEYLVKGHIPGAVFADLFDDFSDPEGEYAFAHPGTKHFERAAQTHGVDNDTAVVVYDTGIGTWAARLWWLFRSYGFEVRVLDGGLAKWRAEGRPTATGDVRPRRAGEFSAYSDPEAWASKHDIEAVLSGDEDAVLLCALPPREFAGDEGGRARRGHIPTSLNIAASLLLDPQTNAYLPVARLRELFAEVTDSGEPIIGYCQSAIASTSDALALALLGRTDVRIYDGSLNEWAGDATAPLELSVPALAAHAASPTLPAAASSATSAEPSGRGRHSAA
ncbi:MAG: rhodanese-like domain-containing protein [Microbacteriaceae bacterium]|nr:rhodanese-like domain-containing protein [Microbacteriaceae bacterium]MCL2795757.1 rhodanese-like domain-containing protein [Microbacteriaceae bacterium]